MSTAFVLINCELGSEESIIKQLKSLPGVVEVHGTFGAYDILAKIESSTVEDLRETCLLYTSPSPRDLSTSRMPSSA